MMARTSCSRTSRLMSLSAFTPPNASEMFSSLRIGEQAFARQFGGHRLDTLLDQLVHLRLGGQIGIARIRDAAALGPVADRTHVDVDECADLVAPVAECDCLFDMREELQFVFD